ncbi:MAG: hypothetical protein M3O36_14890 [Myxococcota bacterium]|nr:hypothetical protein [Myxococcota bacterium]
MEARRLPALVLTALVGCTTPGQYGGLIPVDEDGVSARLRLLCRASAEQGQSHCPDEALPDSGLADEPSAAR